MSGAGIFLILVLIDTLPQLSRIRAGQLPITAPPSVPYRPSGLTIRIYDYAGLGAPTRTKMAEETLWLLGRTHVPFIVIDCTSGRDDDVCRSPERADILTIRVLRRAPNEANRNALGLTVRSPYGTVGLVLHDRAAMLSRQDLPIWQILGRAVAHEVVHLLVPDEPHTVSGLMKSEMTSDHLRPANYGWHWISRNTIARMEAEAMRRTKIPAEEARARIASTGPTQ